MGNFLAQDTNTIRVLQGQLGRDFEKNYNSFLTLDKAFFSDFTAFDLTPKGKMEKKYISYNQIARKRHVFAQGMLPQHRPFYENLVYYPALTNLPKIYLSKHGI